ncbi:ArnT family glycosyltransferase [Hymenobacter yonginensis]|uniref:Glycosyltransferase family 39 protein n=1 Tax=Hymenobacter yonginensis TaxID=748197 RepID=A0ABY7PML6_9BACT|nr:glycosyltransferase family 39 protein [Hymenobacter yonginensis]WBO84207.1 glycosyltransferase family 39 protein [Hymenobacter yonginensis]
MSDILTNWSKLPRWFWPLLIGLNFLLHAPFFSQPPVGLHTWRQSNTMAVIRNFYEEDMNIMRPRVDRRNESDGVTGMQFPSYEWTVAAVCKAVGFHEGVARVVNWLIFAGGVIFCYHLFRRITQSVWMAAVAAWCLSWSPELFYHCISALPDVLALSASLGGLWLFLRWWDTRHSLSFWGSLLLTTLAGATKLQFLLIGFPIAGLVVQALLSRQFDWRRSLLPLFFFAVVSVGLPLAWYAYSLRLIETSGLADFGLEVRPADDLRTGLGILLFNIKSDWPEMLLGYGSAVMVLVGAGQMRLAGVRRSPWMWPALLWVGGVAVYYVFELRQMKDHGYYMLPLLPLFVWAAAKGSEVLRRNVRWHWLLALILFSQPVWAGVRVMKYWLRGPRDVPSEMYYPQSRALLENAVPNDALCLVGPDESGCKQFYFVHKKGFGLESSERLSWPTTTGEPYVADCIARGAQYLYLSDSTLLTNPYLAPYVGPRVVRVGAVQVFKLQMPAGR